MGTATAVVQFPEQVFIGEKIEPDLEVLAIPIQARVELVDLRRAGLRRGPLAS